LLEYVIIPAIYIRRGYDFEFPDVSGSFTNVEEYYMFVRDIYIVLDYLGAGEFTRSDSIIGILDTINEEFVYR
jgi:hypothetical protein